MRVLLFLYTFLFFLNSNAQIARADSIKAAEYSIKNLEINTKYQDFGTTYMGKDKIVFSSSRKKPGINKVWKENDQPFLDLYIGDVHEDGEIVNVETFSTDVNSKFHDAFVAFSPDLKEVYFTSNSYIKRKLRSRYLKIFKATVAENGEWKHFVSLPFNDHSYDTGHPVLNEDGTKLYFVSNMPGTLGDTDIFVVDIKDGHYGKVENLGSAINSPAKEFSPYIDGDVIYFSSNRKGGLGGYDIYMTKLDGSIPEPINLGEPINSKGDDFSFVIDNAKLKGFFSSNRAGGVGDDDIYAFEQKTTIPICDQTITGVVKDRVTGLLVLNAFVALIDNEDVQLRKEETLADGEFYFSLDCGTDYTIEVTKKDFFPVKTELLTSHVNGYKNELVIWIDEIEFFERNGRELLNVENISFELNKADIKEESKEALDKVIRLMNKYPDMIIEFGAHTDSRGGDDYNLDLTEKRAVATVDYLTSRGINASRITGKGYGETQLLNNCANGVKCTELEHNKNKRTEFVVIKR